MQEANYWIEKLQLQAHPEGGFYKELYRASEQVSASALPERYGAERSLGTAIYFLLRSTDYSAFHRLQSDEHWHFHAGSSGIIHFISPAGTYFCQKVGLDLAAGEQPLVSIPHNHWFAAEVAVANSYLLVSCTVMPGFDFADFELAGRQELINQHPQHEAVITRFTPQKPSDTI